MALEAPPQPTQRAKAHMGTCQNIFILHVQSMLKVCGAFNVKADGLSIGADSCGQDDADRARFGVVNILLLCASKLFV